MAVSGKSQSIEGVTLNNFEQAFRELNCLISLDARFLCEGDLVHTVVSCNNAQIPLLRPGLRPDFEQKKVADVVSDFFKPPPPIGAGGGYMFSGRPSVPLSVRASVCPSVIHVVVSCFRDVSSIC